MSNVPTYLEINESPLENIEITRLNANTVEVERQRASCIPCGEPRAFPVIPEVRVLWTHRHGRPRTFVPSTVAWRFPVGMPFSGSSRATSCYRSLLTMTRDSREKGEIRCNFGSLVFAESRSKTESSRNISDIFVSNRFLPSVFRLFSTFSIRRSFSFQRTRFQYRTING